eukprot:4280945-Pyramimonas_sp.AAC.1
MGSGGKARIQNISGNPGTYVYLFACPWAPFANVWPSCWPAVCAPAAAPALKNCVLRASACGPASRARAPPRS